MINIIKQDLRSIREDPRYQANPSIKIGTKPYARSRRNELTEMTGHWRKVIGHSDQEARQQARPDAGPDASGRSIGRRTTESGRVQRGSRATKMQPDASGGM